MRKQTEGYHELESQRGIHFLSYRFMNSFEMIEMILYRSHQSTASPALPDMKIESSAQHGRL